LDPAPTKTAIAKTATKNLFKGNLSRTAIPLIIPPKLRRASHPSKHHYIAASRQIPHRINLLVILTEAINSHEERKARMPPILGSPSL
jgi:hypothetical protein